MESYFENVVMPQDNLRIDSFYTSSFEHVIDVHPHWHPEVEILYIVKGCARQQINDSFFVTAEGDIIIVNKDQLHSTYSYQESNCDILVVMADTDSMLDLTCGSQIINSGVVFRNPMNYKSEYGKVVYECVLEIHRGLTIKDNAYQFMVKSQFYRLIGTLIKSGCYDMVQKQSENTYEAKYMLENTFRLIDESYFTDISLKKAAEASNLSTPHFCRLFKKTTGMTFMNYLSFYRVNRAERLLNTRRTITQVAHECGFGSLSSFIRNYKKFKKVTPSSHKKHIAHLKYL